VLDQFATNPKLCRYIDLPLQHVSDRILERMRRPYRRADIDLVLEQLRAIPDMHIRTTMIVGFPGETEAEFDELLDFVRAARLDRLSAYAYSPEPGTPAFGLRPRVTPEAKRERVRRLMLAQARVSRANLRRLIGRELEVIVDEPGVGRTEWDAPEVDGIVRLTGAKAPPGSMARVLVTGASTHDLTAHVLPRRPRPQRID
jgi:ribosomal protein S12 methylthiotransferase